VHWGRANLVDPEAMAVFAMCSVIFCRNVFIYFSDRTIAQTVRRFAVSMQRPGYLFVGAAESLLKLTDDFELEEAEDGFVYVLRSP
jgi:chemotaxis protein methyltransferase CheR